MEGQVDFKVKTGSTTYNDIVKIYVDYELEASGGFPKSRFYQEKLRTILGLEKDNVMMFYPALFFKNQEMIIRLKENWIPNGEFNNDLIKLL